MSKNKLAWMAMFLATVLVISAFSVSSVLSLERDEDGNWLTGSEVIDIPNSTIKRSDYPFPDHYPSVQELYDWYDDLIAEYPNLISKTHIGNSWEGRDLWVLEITSDEDVQVDEKPGVLIDGGMHAREWSGPQVASYLMWRLLNEYDTNETIYWLLNNRIIYIMPMQNPDGYIYDGNGVYENRAAWRKNRNDSTPNYAVGVDLNRNWDIAWEDGNTDPSSNQYRGEAPFSEYENWHLRDFMLSRDIQSYQNIHSYHGSLLIPWAYTTDPSPHDEWYRGMAAHMTSLTSRMGDQSWHYAYGQADELIGYSPPGTALDWIYDISGATSLCYEIHTGGSGTEGFYPDPSDIMTINQDVDDSLIYQMRVSDTDLGDGTTNIYPPVPYILYGTVTDVSDGSPVADMPVTLENLDTGETLEINTGLNGYYELNYGNLVEFGYTQSDTFSVSAWTSSNEFSIGGEWGSRIDMEVMLDGEPPSVNLVAPNGGEEWYGREDEYISWTTEEGDDPIDHINLWYSMDAGSTWKTIIRDIDDTGNYLWRVPNVFTDECLVRVRAIDTLGRWGEDISDDVFTIVGVPPDPPQNLDVEHISQWIEVLFEDDVEGGDLGYITGKSHDEASEWGIRQHGASSGVNSWDFGDGAYNVITFEGPLSWLITPEITVPANATQDHGVWLTFEHWRDFHSSSTTLYDGGNVKLSTSGSDGPWSIITPEEGYDGDLASNFDQPLAGQPGWSHQSDWTTATFDLTDYIGETIHIRWDAGVSWAGNGDNAGWRIDDLRMETLISDEDGDKDNRITWNPSSDETIGEVSHYNLYRSEDPNGPWDGSTFVDSFTADGAANYSYVDPNRGMADEIFWWYVVRAVGTNGLEDQNTDAVQEPGGETETFDIPLSAGGDAGGWNFVSFNLIPTDTSLEAILADIDGNYDRVMYYDSSTGEWSSYVPGRAERYNNLQSWSHRMGIWIRMTTGDTLTIEGSPPASTDITLYSGWTMVGLPSETAGNHGLPGEVDRVGYFDDSQTYNLAYDYSPEAFSFEPGKGYWVHNPTDTAVVWTVDY